MPPFIAVTSDIEDAKTRRHFLNDSYSSALYDAGCIPLIVAAPDVRARSGFANWARAIMTNVSGLLLTGGDDVNAMLYGGVNHPFNGVFTEERDYFEIELCRAAVGAKKPLLGICRGIQILNAALGGTLFQDIEAEHKETPVLQHGQKAPSWSAVHEVELKPASLAAIVCGGEKLAVNSFHHQAVRDVAPGFIASAFSSDGIIEAIEPESTGEDFLYGAPHGFTLGVQWHPERMTRHHAHAEKLFREFAAVCAQ